MKLVRTAVTVAVSLSLLALSSCGVDVNIRNECSSTLYDIEVDGESIGDLSPGESASAEVDERGRTEITWTYDGYSQQEWISGSGAYEDATYDLYCTYGYWH